MTELNCTRTHCRLKRISQRSTKEAHTEKDGQSGRQTEEQNAGAEKMSGLKISAQLSTFSSTYTTPALHMLLIHFPTFHSPLLLFLFLHHHHQLMITNVHRVCLLSSAVKAKRLRCSNAAAAASAVQVEVCLSLPPECLSTQEMLKWSQEKGESLLLPFLWHIFLALLPYHLVIDAPKKKSISAQQLVYNICVCVCRHTTALRCAFDRSPPPPLPPNTFSFLLAVHCPV